MESKDIEDKKPVFSCIVSDQDDQTADSIKKFKKRWAENSISKTMKSAAPFGYKKCAVVGILPSQRSLLKKKCKLCYVILPA